MAAVRHLDLIITSNATAAIRGFSDLGAIAKSTEKRFGSLAGAMARIGTVGAAGAIGFAGASVKAFIDFDDAMVKSIAIMDNVSGPMRKKMEDAAKSVAKTTTFSATEAATAYKSLGSAGLTAEQAMRALPVVATFAQAAQMDLARASEYLVDAQAALGIKMKDPIENMKQMTRVSDVLTKANNLATGEIEDFAAALTNKAGAALKTTNKDIEEGVAVLAYLAEQGVKGAAAGEKLAIALRDIPRAASRNSDEFKKLGISVFDSSGNLKNMADVVAEFETALGPMNDAQRASTLENLGLTRSVGDVIRQLLGGSEKIRGFESALRGAGGTAQEVADKQMVSLKEKLGLVRDQFQVMMIDFGEPIAIWLVDSFMPWLQDEFLPELKNVAGVINDELSPALELMGAAFSNDQFVTALAGMTAFAVGMATASRIISGIGKLLAPIGKVFQAIGFVIGIILHPVAKLSELFLWLQIKLLPLQAAFGKLLKFLAPVGRVLASLGGVFMTVAQVIAGVFGVSVGVVFAVIAAVVAAAAALWIFRDQVAAALGAVGRFFQRLWTNYIYPYFAGPIKDFFTGTFVDVVQGAWNNFVRPVLDTFAWMLSNVVMPVLSDLGNIGESVWGALGTIVSVVWNNIIWPALKGLADLLVNVVLPTLGKLGELGGKAWNFLSDAAGKAWENVIKPIGSGLVALYNNVILPAFSKLADIGGWAWSKIAGAISWAWGVVKPITDRWQWLLVAIAIGFSSMYLAGFIAWRLLSAAIKWAWESIAKPVFDAISWTISNVLAPAFFWLKDRVVEAWNIIGSIVSWAWGNVIKPVFDAVSWAVSNVLAPVFFWLRDRVIDVWNAIGFIVGWAWGSVIKPAFDAVSWAVSNLLVPAFFWLKDRAVDVWNAIGGIISWAWNNLIKPAFDAISLAYSNILVPAFEELRTTASDVWGVIGDVINTVWKDLIQPAFNTLSWVLSNMIVPAFESARDIATGAWGVLSEAISMLWNDVIRPVFDAIGWILSNLVVPAFEKARDIAGEAWRALSDAISTVWQNVIKPVWDAIQLALDNVLIPAMGKLQDFVSNVWATVGAVIRTAWINVIKPIWDRLYAIVSTVLIPVLRVLGTIVSFVWGYISSAIQAAWKIIGPIWDKLKIALLVVAASMLSGYIVAFFVFIGIGRLITFAWYSVIKPVWEKIKIFIDMYLLPAFANLGVWVGNVWHGIKVAIRIAWNVIQIIWDAIIVVIRNVLAPVFRFLWEMVKVAWSGIQTAIRIAWTIIQGIWTAISAVIRNVLVPIFKFLWEAIKGAWSGIQFAISVAWTIIRGIWNAIGAVITNVLVPIFKFLWEAIKGAWSGIQFAISVAWTIIRGIWNAIWAVITNVLVPIFKFLWDAIKGAWSGIQFAISVAWTIIRGIWNAIWAVITNVLVPIFNFLWTIIKTVWSGIQTAISFAWNNIIKPIWDTIWAVITNVLVPIFKFLWDIIKTVWSKIQTAISYAWYFVIKPIWDAIWGFITNTLAPKFETLQSVVETVWSGIKDGISTAWDFIKGIWDGIMGFIDDTFLPKWHTLKNGITGAMGHVRDVLARIWDSIKSTAKKGINGVINILNMLIGGVNGAKDLLNKIPGVNIPDIRPIPLVGSGAGSGKGSGSRRAANKASFHAAGGIPNYNPMKEGPTRTHGVRAIVGEGNPNYPEFVIPTDPRHRQNAIKFWQQAGAQLFARGGVLPRGPGIAGLYDPLASKVQAIINEARGQVSITSGWRDSRKQAALYAAYKAGRGATAAPPGSSNHERGAAVDFGGSLSVWRRLAAKHGLIFPVKNENWHAEDPSTRLGGLLSTAAQVVYESIADRYRPAYDFIKPRAPGKDIATAMVKPLNESVMGAFIKLDEQQQSMAYTPGDNANYGGGGAERWRSVALQALNAAGAPASWVGSLLRRMQQESGGNPRAINNWDSNARKGQASRGLMQTIPSTFASYAGPYSNRGIFDPLANVYAAIKYTVARYGSGPAGWDKKGGYKDGGLVNGDQYARLHDKEMVLPSKLSSFIQTAAAQGGGPTTVIEKVEINIPISGTDSDEEILRKARLARKPFDDIIAQRRILVDARTS